MTKAEMISQIAEETGLTKVQAENAFQAVINVVTKEVKAGGNITFPGFGSFSLGQRAARKGRNPQTGDEIDIPASKTVKFKMSSVLKEEINKK